MKMPETVKPWLQFTRKERIAILTLISLILLIWFSPRLVQVNKNTGISKVDSSWALTMQEAEMQSTGYKNDPDEDTNASNNGFHQPGKEAIPESKLFPFDPNTAGFSDWKRLGIRDKTIHTIENYLSKGGHFYKPQDLKRIYGMHPDEYERLKPYITIGSPIQESKGRSSGPSTVEAENRSFDKTRYKIIDINAADITEWIALPGIGSKLASRIVNFREKLGGFYSRDQVKETYGLVDSVYDMISQYLSITSSDTKKISINTATKDELKIHPYIKWNLANAIVEYRKQHGKYSSLENLKNIPIVDEITFEKIRHYLSL